MDSAAWQKCLNELRVDGGWWPPPANYSVAADVVENEVTDLPTSSAADVITARLHRDHAGAGVDLVRDIIRSKLVPVLCAFGVLGNLSTLTVFASDRMRLSCDRTERTVLVWLKALAVADLVFCAALLPHGLLPDDRFLYPRLTFELVYRCYGVVVINSALLTSTWLTVAMAAARYRAICRRPFELSCGGGGGVVGRGGSEWGVRRTRACAAVLFVAGALFNVPRVVVERRRIEVQRCADGGAIYAQNAAGHVTSSSSAAAAAASAYAWIYFVVGTVLPLAALAFCNFRLVAALRESSRVRRQFCPLVIGSSSSSSTSTKKVDATINVNRRITCTLVAIVVLYLVLVSPSEVLVFVEKQLLQTDTMSDGAAGGPSSLPLPRPEAVVDREWIGLAIELTNVLQTANFCGNFILYSVVNGHFRRVIEDQLACRRCRRRRHQRCHRCVIYSPSLWSTVDPDGRKRGCRGGSGDGGGNGVFEMRQIFVRARKNGTINSMTDLL